MSCHGRMSDCQGVTKVIVHGSTAISAPPTAVGPDQSAGPYDKCLIAPLVGPSAWDPIRGEYVAIRRMAESASISGAVFRQSIDERAGQDEVEELVQVRGDGALSAAATQSLRIG
jgi:hypothetical protein